MELPKINASEIIELIESGSTDPLLIKIWLKETYEALEEIEEKANPLARTEAEKYGQKSFDKNGYRFELAEFGTSYNFTGTNHPKWNKLYTEIKKVNTEMKSLENTLKTLKASITIADEDTGEIVTVYPPAKKSTSGIKLMKLK